MSNQASQVPDQPTKDAAHGAVIVGAIPDQSPRVLQEAVRQARAFEVPLLVVYVDVTRFVTHEDPDGYVHSSPIDLNIANSEGEFEGISAAAAAALEGTGVEWSARQLVGDPALAIKHLAEKIDARLIVIGTRKRGFGESLREFFTGSVAARLAHRQHRPILVIPVGEAVDDDAHDPWVESHS